MRVEQHTTNKCFQDFISKRFPPGSTPSATLHRKQTHTVHRVGAHRASERTSAKNVVVVMLRRVDNFALRTQVSLS